MVVVTKIEMAPVGGVKAASSSSWSTTRWVPIERDVVREEEKSA